MQGPDFIHKDFSFSFYLGSNVEEIKKLSFGFNQKPKIETYSETNYTIKISLGFGKTTSAS